MGISAAFVDHGRQLCGDVVAAGSGSRPGCGARLAFERQAPFGGERVLIDRLGVRGHGGAPY
jgi:hypothetical protein